MLRSHGSTTQKCAVPGCKRRKAIPSNRCKQHHSWEAVTSLSPGVTVYQTKLGTIPYANIIARRPLAIGDRFYLPRTTAFKPVKPIYRPRNWHAVDPVIVDRIDGDLLFLSKA